MNVFKPIRSTIQMDIHIRHDVEFEKILASDWPKALALTRTRMSLQQLLDAKTSDAQLQTRLNEYILQIDNAYRFVASQANTPLQTQPLFSWSVNRRLVQTPCWRIETVLPRVALANALYRQGLTALVAQKHLEAGSLFTRASQRHQETRDILTHWRWRQPELQIQVLQADWHAGQHHHMLALKNMCMLSVGIDRDTGTSTCFTVAQRAVKHAAAAVAVWPDNDAKHILPIAETMRYAYSSTLFWNAHQYGASIHTLTHWVGPDIDTGPFAKLAEELTTVPLLLRERQHTNDGAYFDKIEPATDLVPPAELIHMEIDAPHPTRMSTPDAAHDTDTT